MAYLAKSTVLHAYKLLSGIDSEKQQGLTQKVSALKYASALDLFYKNHGQNCDLKQSANRDIFAAYVGEIVKINDAYCTKDFFLSIASNGRDFDCGSNFYSQSSVKDSKTNPANTFLYPKRSGWKPVMDIQDQVLIYRADYLKDCFSFYLSSSELRLAFIVWLLRFKQISEENLNGIKSTLNTVFTLDYCKALYTNDINHVDTSYVEFDEDVCQLINEDVKSLFANSSNPYTEQTMKFPLQQIFYGAPGTGKSHEVKKLTGEWISEGEEKDLPNVFRTTFHPDTDYASFVGCYKPTMKPTSKEEKTLTGKDEEIVYEFVPQVFTDAYVYAYNNSDQPTYLVIEEINRGNCAQIFGDLFQLLDRKGGVSEYKIKADKDLAQYLREQLGADSEGIQDGKLCLRANLHILATMNTSDQSLFPMDSAFKRRWDWEYVPIKYDTTIKSGEFDITIGDKSYSWVEFIKKVNEKIFDLTQSEDKQMGNFFIKQSIDEKGFKSKVMFYLWYEVLRDETENNKYFFYGKTTIDGKEVLSKFTFKDLYGDQATETLQQFMDYLEVASK